jgi:hypothetical protein
VQLDVAGESLEGRIEQFGGDSHHLRLGICWEPSGLQALEDLGNRNAEAYFSEDVDRCFVDALRKSLGQSMA